MYMYISAAEIVKTVDVNISTYTLYHISQLYVNQNRRISLFIFLTIKLA